MALFGHCSRKPAPSLVALVAEVIAVHDPGVIISTNFSLYAFWAEAAVRGDPEDAQKRRCSHTGYQRSAPPKVLLLCLILGFLPFLLLDL
eukprot:CAMPEP_0204512096 /NCGR_PEP_ID=MMETSP0661-20131031/782_1 /ASSEMBLY_ACC=CAM_ASM_000606 /TAXON_ID=109239 /ORGANISM="Alexandrium margalefi, Strain AMGDE01CS-322" /LENGTH=89 /DNA_ID=CAMNT_0051517211 /DNA_START=31 /DNA_END=297 /DNA_ORIENTATION=-